MAWRPLLRDLNSLLSYPLPLGRLANGRADVRLRGIVAAHFEAMWRLLRRLGVPEHDLDDAVQEVIWVLARKLEAVAIESERAFVLSTAYRVASTMRRSRRRRPEMVELSGEHLAAPGPDPEGLLEQQRARAWLDEALAALPLELRAVFVLYELERLTMAEIAEALGLAAGTVASRLRRARAAFQLSVTAIEHRLGVASR